jgi:hypothetical protein
MESKKLCKRCGQKKSVTEFQVNRHKEDGFDYLCKDCDSQRRKLLREGDPEKYRMKNREYRKANPDKFKEIEAKRAGTRKLEKQSWRQKNIEKCREHDRQYRADNRRYCQLLTTAWQRGKKIQLNRVEFNVWFNGQPKICFYCGKIIVGRDLTIDRKDNDKGYRIDNMALSCGKCNKTKNDVFTSEEWQEIYNHYVKPKIEKGIIKW